MPSYSIEVESIAVAQLTGRVGTAVVTYRGKHYRIPLGARGATCNEVAIDVADLPSAVYQFAQNQYDRLSAEIERRT